MKSKFIQIVVMSDSIKLLGCETAVFLSYMIEKQQCLKKKGDLKDGFFYCTMKKIEEEIDLKQRIHKKAVRKLKELKILKIKKEGMPQKLWYSINEKELVKIFPNFKKLVCQTKPKFSRGDKK